jgi:histidinol-phosphatase (PHP family)
MNIDIHVHSNHSCDAKSTMDEMCRSAISKGVSVICFTEHVDMNPKDEGVGYFQYEKYSADIELAREKYQQHLTILKGIEFSEPHLYPTEFETVTRADFDFVLGSVHWLEEFGPYWEDDSRLLPTFPAQRLFEVYYNEVLKTIRFGGFDSLAHMDFPKRYLLNKYEPQGILDEITGELVKRGIALEINSHPIRKGYPEINPSDNICAIYSKHGGIKVTTGSDAHRDANVGQDFDHLARIIHLYKFKPVFFVNRQETEPSNNE